MKRLWLIVVALGIAACLLFVYGRSHNSPRIVCDMGGKIVPTVFTFDSFKQTLAAEQGKVEATGYDQLKTKSLLVSFRLLPDGTLLAERAMTLKSDKLVDPAILFGINGALLTVAPENPDEVSGTNVPVIIPVKGADH